MSKRRRQDEEDGQASYHDRSGNKHKSLYLVLDDWHRGFTISRLDADSPDLSAPHVFRLASPLNRHVMDFVALGSNIIATSNQCAATVVFDTETDVLAIGNPLPGALRDANNYFVTAGDDMLFAFAYHFMSGPPSCEVMTTAPKDKLRSLCPNTDWSWESIPTPFTKDQRIVSYALHPDGRTIFVSVDNRESSGTVGTFSFDSENRKWKRHGEWMLPFELQGYFDPDLDGWVGLHPDGYICSCQVPSLSGSSNNTTQQPSWKIAKEHRMWSPRYQVRNAQGATLIYMGNSRFFLADCVIADGFEFQDAFGDPNGFVLHMTTFRLKYNHQGKLRIVDRNTTSCPVSRQLSWFSPVAFWM